MYVDHKKPCSYCPFRRTSAPGWLGASTPTEFMGQTLGEVEMPCHSTIDYEADDWHDQAEEGPYCAGALTFLRNVYKLPNDLDHARARNAVQQDHETVFSSRAQFLEHHTQFERR